MWFIEDETPGYKLQWKSTEFYSKTNPISVSEVIEMEELTALLLDGAIQITEKDEFIYNEMISHTYAYPS